MVYSRDATPSSVATLLPERVSRSDLTIVHFTKIQRFYRWGILMDRIQ
jgi:hypothetical protein